MSDLSNTSSFFERKSSHSREIRSSKIRLLCILLSKFFIFSHVLEGAHDALLMYAPPYSQPPQQRVQVSSRQRLFSWRMQHQPAEIHWALAHTLSVMMSIVLQSRMSYNRELCSGMFGPGALRRGGRRGGRLGR